MAWQLLIVQLALFPFLVTPSSAAAAPIAKGNCTTHCGETAIPYPFGIGAGCYLDEWFEIICTESDTVPLLNRTNQEVTDISHDGTITVKNPITFANCGRKDENKQSPSLEGSPFRFSQAGNTFISVACGSIALMNNTRGSTIGVCLSVCSGDGLALDKSCGGMGCCQMTVPPELQAFVTDFLDVDMNSINHRRESACRYAFLVNRKWFSSEIKNISALLEMAGVPVILEWGLYNISEKQVFGTSVETSVSGNTDNLDDDHELYSISDYYYNQRMADDLRYRNGSCEVIGVTSSLLVNRSMLKCSCPIGFNGNPYLLRGCYGNSFLQLSSQISILVYY